MTLLNSNIEIWQTAYEWLIQCGNKVNANYCKEEITAHPDYPALTSIIDFLDSGEMEYKAVKADASYIYNFNYPLLAHIRQPGQENLFLVKNASVWEKETQLIQHWTGIAVYPGINSSWQNEQNFAYHRKSVKNRIIAFSLSSVGVCLFILSVIHFSNTLYNLFGLLALFGLIVSIFLLGAELGFQSQLIKQVCGAVSQGGCEQVIKSRYAKGFAGITAADASVLYFSAQFIAYLLGCWYISLFISIVLLAFIGILVSGWSIYIQAVRVKQWCALCLGVVGILILQSIVAGFLLQSLKITSVNNSFYEGLEINVLLILVFALVLWPIKQLIKTNISNKLKLVELKKWKLDMGLFINQWQQEQEIDTTIWSNDLLLGNALAPVLITVACNPYCNPCAKSHEQLDKMLHRFPSKLKVQLRLLCNVDNETDKRTLAVAAILRRAETIKSTINLQKVLTDWFEWMDYEKWNAKWQPDININIQERLQDHNKWAEKNSIAFTPTFFINGRKLPSRYSLDDLAIFLPQLIAFFLKKIPLNN